MSLLMSCPHCGLINPPTARRCDCGYEFSTQTSNELRTAHVPDSEDESGNRNTVDSYLDHYLDSPQPERAHEMLRAFLKSPVTLDQNNVTWYFFARIAQDNPLLLRAYEPLLYEIPEGRTFLLLILWQCGDDQTKVFLDACRSDPEFAAVREQIDHISQKWQPGFIRPLEHPAESAADLDLLWCEFRATGNLAAVLRIIDVLEQTDIVREKLGAWLRESPRKVVVDLCKELFREASILCDSELGEVLSPQDLDSHCMMEDLNISKPQFDKLSVLLPFAISEDAQRSVIKPSAKWSLASHAMKFPQILELCRSESGKRTGRCRLALLEIIARLALGKEDYETAFNTLTAAVTLDPKKREQQAKMAEAEWERLEALSAEGAEESSGTGHSHREAAALCVRATQEARTVRVKQSLRKAGHTEIGPGDTTWECEFERPRKFRVFQRMWLGGEVGDEWITVAGVNFQGPAYADGPNPSEAVNHGLVPDAYLGLLRKCKPVSFGAYDFRDRHYLRFEYKNAPRPARNWMARFLAFARFPWCRCDAVAWVDAETSRLVKVVLALNAPSNEGIPNEEVSLYCYFDEPLSIVAPPFSLIRKMA